MIEHWSCGSLVGFIKWEQTLRTRDIRHFLFRKQLWVLYINAIIFLQTGVFFCKHFPVQCFFSFCLYSKGNEKTCKTCLYGLSAFAIVFQYLCAIIEAKYFVHKGIIHWMVNIPFCAGVYFQALGSLFDCPMQKEQGKAIRLFVWSAAPGPRWSLWTRDHLGERPWPSTHVLPVGWTDAPQFLSRRGVPRGTKHPQAHLRGAPCATRMCLVTCWCCHH